MKGFNPFRSKRLKTLFCTGRINNSNLFLKTEIDSEFLILPSKLNQSLKKGKRILEAVCSTAKDWNMAISCYFCFITF